MPKAIAKNKIKYKKKDKELLLENPDLQLFTSFCTEFINNQKSATGRKRAKSEVRIIDAFQERWCENCGTDQTPSWRRDILGERLLCNACGL